MKQNDYLKIYSKFDDAYADSTAWLKFIKKIWMWQNYMLQEEVTNHTLIISGTKRGEKIELQMS